MLETFRDIAESTVGFNLSNVSDIVIMLMGIILILIAIISIFALGV